MNISKHLAHAMNPIISEMQMEVRKKDKNVIIAILGDPGNGKTTAAASMALAADPTFNIDRVKTTVSEFMDASSSSDFPKYSSVLFDEFAIAVSKRKWQSKQNIVWGENLQTFRSQNLILFLTMPMLNLADMVAEKFVDYIFIALETDKTHEYVTLAPYESQNNILYDKQYTKALIRRVKSEDNELRKLPLYFVGFPPKELHDQIRDKVEAHKANIRSEGAKTLNKQKIEEELDYKKKLDKVNKIPVSEIGDTLKSKFDDYVKYYHGRFVVNAAKIKTEYPSLTYREVDLLKHALQSDERFKKIKPRDVIEDNGAHG